MVDNMVAMGCSMGECVYHRYSKERSGQICSDPANIRRDSNSLDSGDHDVNGVMGFIIIRDLGGSSSLLRRGVGNGREETKMRIGTGYDVHRLVKGRKLIIGGVEIEHTMGLDGHSDADVLLHAITDAMLGAAALGDIGLHFPDTDEKWKGADSVELMQAAQKLLSDEGYEIVNIDSTVMAEEPKLRPYIDSMRGRIADALGLDVRSVSVKATTEEGLGFTGAKQGIAAQAVVLID